MANTLHSQCRWLGLIPGQGTRPHMPQPDLAQAKQINKYQILIIKKWETRMHGEKAGH